MLCIKSIMKLKFIFIVLSLESIKCSIDGTFSEHRPDATKAGDDPCNPLYWYPKNIPEYCHFKKMSTLPAVREPDLPIPVPVPVPLPPPLPIPMPIPIPVVPPPVMPPHVMPPGSLPPVAVPHSIMPLPMHLPFGIPLAPTNIMVPVAGVPMVPPPPTFPGPYPPQYPLPYPPTYGTPYPPPFSAPYPPYPGPYAPPYPFPHPMPSLRGIGIVPGIPGLVSPDGGINIMPFSDAYSDMLERHKQKMIRRRLQKFRSNYERPPWKTRRNTRRQNGNEVIYEENLDENATD